MAVASLYMAEAELLAELELAIQLVVVLVHVLQEVRSQGRQGWMRKIGVDHNSYLSRTRTYGIVYRLLPHQSNFFYGYADTAYGNADDHRSTTGYVFIAGEGAITWSSKKQIATALSSTEAEYKGLLGRDSRTGGYLVSPTLNHRMKKIDPLKMRRSELKSVNYCQNCYFCSGKCKEDTAILASVIFH